MFAAALILPAATVPLPPAVAAMLDAAAASGNAATLKAVADMARQTNPGSRADIDTRLAGYAAAAAKAQQERLATQAWHEGISGQGEIGLTRSTGNTDSTGVALRVNLTKKTRNWKHGVRATVDYQRSNGVTRKQRYAAGYEGNVRLSDRLYTVAVLGFERDSFAGYSSRFTESLGVGYKLVASRALTVGVEAGGALRQTAYARVPDENSPAGRLAVDTNWKLSPEIALTSNATAYVEDVNTTLAATTAMTFKVTSALSARASVVVRHETDPPPRLDDTDTTTAFTLVYGF